MPLSPAVVICLGNTGACVVEHLRGRLGAPVQSAVQILLIAGCPPVGVLPGPADRNIELNLGAGHAKEVFRSNVGGHFWHYRQWLRAVPANGSPVPVFVVASAAEPEVELLSDVLVQLRNSPRKFNPLIGLFTLASAAAVFPVPLYVALRETGRFTFSGPHVVEDGPPFHNKCENNSLLDHVIFSGRQDAANGAVEVLMEALYALLNDCSGLILREELNQAIVIHGANIERHAAVAHTLGAATVPIVGAAAGPLPAAAAQLAGIASLNFANSCVAENAYRVLTASNQQILDASINVVFPFGAAAVNTRECGAVGLLSALELQTNILFSEFDEVVAANQAYQFGSAHSCKQEENAQKYEQRFRVPIGAQVGRLRRELPAELTMGLASLQLATIFFQGLICGQVKNDGLDSGWVVCAIGAFGELALKADGVVGNDSLWNAFQVFTVRHPYSNNTAGNWLHAATRDEYLNALHQSAKSVRLDPGFDAVQAAMRLRIAEWRVPGTDDLLDDFLDMLEAELIRPVWSGW